MTSLLASMMIFLAAAIGPQAPVQSPAAGGGNAVKASTVQMKQDGNPAQSAEPAPPQFDPARGILWDDQRLLERVSRIA